MYSILFFVLIVFFVFVIRDCHSDNRLLEIAGYLLAIGIVGFLITVSISGI